jgi:hypothetical protein
MDDDRPGHVGPKHRGARMRISKVLRKGSGAVSALNVVIAANLGEADQETSTSSRQHVEIVQRDGHTEVHERLTDAKES